MEGFVGFTNRCQGRDQLFRATQYTCMLLSYLIKNKADKKKLVMKLKQLESSMSSGRKSGCATMTVKKSQTLQNGSAKENVLQRVLQLPVVSSTCESLQRTYTSTKEAHPLMASVCEVYERGMQGAGALAMWGMEPVVRRLEPQFAVANNLACRGLDHLEEKIPALQYPVDKLASELKDTISCPLQSAKSTIGSSMDKIIELAAEGYEATKSTVETTAKYTRKNSVTQMAAAGVDTALGGLEKLMEYLLPEEDEEADQKPKKKHQSTAKVSQQQASTASSASAASAPSGCSTPSAPSTPSSPSTLGRIGALVSSVSHRAYQQTTQSLQRAKTKGQELATWIPIVGSLAKPSIPAAPPAHSDGQSSTGGRLSRRQSKAPEQKQEKAGKKDNNHSKAGEDPGLVGSVAHNLQSACASGISTVKKVPAVAWDAAEGLILFTPRRLSRAMETVDALGGTLISAPKHLLGTLYSFVPLRRQSAKEAEAPKGSKSDPEKTEKKEEKEDTKAAAPSAEEKSQLRGDWRYRGHHPLSFLGLEDPLFLRHNYYRSPAFEPEYPFPRKSAFSPYNRRVSEGSYRFSPESMYSRAYYGNLYTPVFKKD
ncbi:peroxisomal membrane protein 11A isoform X1 [Pipra filicauda]|uniref:Peroxisomal membrane protein 11A isoform X1 n=2 Tax=Pipra filicauda TaxID=649802 RepID=A0A7R5K7Y6_9PASS|nr:peroxisomal membrane protein 11A isoform X1 [Pipra filicauda]